jgi:hypothetical protein
LHGGFPVAMAFRTGISGVLHVKQPAS